MKSKEEKIKLIFNKKLILKEGFSYSRRKTFPFQTFTESILNIFHLGFSTKPKFNFQKEDVVLDGSDGW